MLAFDTGNSTIVSNSYFIRSEVPNQPLITAFVLKDKSVFVESKFNEVFSFFNKLIPHFFFLEGVRDFLIPTISEPEDYYEVIKLMPRNCIHVLILQKYEKRFLSDYDKGKSIKKVLELIIKDITYPCYKFTKKIKDHSFRAPGNNMSIEGRIKNIQSDQDLLNILKHCSVERCYHNACNSWFQNVIKNQETLIQKIAETSYVDIKLSAAFLLRNKKL